jgi:hypothetical protein
MGYTYIRTIMAAQSDLVTILGRLPQASQDGARQRAVGGMTERVSLKHQGLTAGCLPRKAALNL